jgi:hypothetical protein
MVLISSWRGWDLMNNSLSVKATNGQRFQGVQEVVDRINSDHRSEDVEE